MTIDTPPEEAEVVPGVRWGRPEWVPSPAFWAALARASPEIDAYVSAPGTPLVDVVAFCMLGGHGITAEMNQAAFDALGAEGFLDRPAGFSEGDLERILRRPLPAGGGLRRYRFPRQKAKWLAGAMCALANEPASPRDVETLRSRLLAIAGIGPKTAAWIVRNWLGSDEVAIIDVHIIRACRIMGVFPDSIRLPDDYGALEQRFLRFAAAIGVRASALDAMMWREMRRYTPRAQAA